MRIRVLLVAAIVAYQWSALRAADASDSRPVEPLTADVANGQKSRVRPRRLLPPVPSTPRGVPKRRKRMANCLAVSVSRNGQPICNPKLALGQTVISWCGSRTTMTLPTPSHTTDRRRSWLEPVTKASRRRHNCPCAG